MTTYLITGANRGLGLELTRQLLERCDDVIACARDMTKVDALSELRNKHGEHLVLRPLDVTNKDSTDALQRYLAGKTVDVLFNNAGTIGPDVQSTLEMDFDGWAETFAINTLGPLRVAHVVLPALRNSGAPKIINVSSRMGSFSYDKSDRIAYRSSKSALNKVVQALALDLRAENIICLAMHPGWVQTDMGGMEADLTPQQSCAGLIKVSDEATMTESGSFLGWDGEPLSW